MEVGDPGGAVADPGEIAKLRAAYGVLLDPDVGDGDQAVEVESVQPLVSQAMRAAVDHELREAPGSRGVEIRVGGVCPRCKYPKGP